MSYTPINWQTGDTITAEKLNKMDNGWGVEETQLFSETVTTVAGSNPYAVGQFSSSEVISGSTIIVVFNNVTYECNNTAVDADSGEYGAAWSDELENFDFSTYPFHIYSDAYDNELYTDMAGSYTITIKAKAIEVSNDFCTVVNESVNAPLLCISGVTKSGEIQSAYDTQRLMYFTDKHITSAYHWYVITYADVDRRSFEFYPENANLNINIVNGIFTVTSV